MKKGLKKYPLFVGLIISFVIIASSIFVLAFCGMRLGTSLGGGSQFEISISDSAETKTYVENIKSICKKEGLTVDSCIVEDKFLADNENGTFTQRYIVVKILASNVSDEKELAVRTAIAEKLSVSVDKVSSIENIISSIKTREILLLGLGIGAIAICLFIFGLIRYDIFAGLAFLLANLHNIILYFSIIIISRVPLSLVSLAAVSISTLVMSAVMVSIFERYKVESELHLAEKETPSLKMLRAEKQAIKPYIIMLIGVVLFAALLFFVPVINVVFSILSVLIAVVVSVHSAILIGPAVYSAFLDISYANFQATLSRNDTVNKVIKKKIAKNTKKTTK